MFDEITYAKLKKKQDKLGVNPTTTTASLTGLEIDGVGYAIQGGGGTGDYTKLNNKPQVNGNELLGNKTSAELGLQDALVSGTNIKTINGVSVLGSGNIAVETYQAFPEEFITTGTTANFVDSVLDYTGAVAGMAWLGMLRCTDLPAKLKNAEATATMMSDDLVVVTLISADTAPYHWEYNSWPSGRVWRAFSQVTPSTSTVTGATTARSLKINGTDWNLPSGGAAFTAGQGIKIADDTISVDDVIKSAYDENGFGSTRTDTSKDIEWDGSIEGRETFDVGEGQVYYKLDYTERKFTEASQLVGYKVTIDTNDETTSIVITQEMIEEGFVMVLSDSTDPSKKAIMVANGMLLISDGITVTIEEETMTIPAGTWGGYYNDGEDISKFVSLKAQSTTQQIDAKFIPDLGYATTAQLTAETNRATAAETNLSSQLENKFDKTGGTITGSTIFNSTVNNPFEIGNNSYIKIEKNNHVLTIGNYKNSQIIDYPTIICSASSGLRTEVDITGVTVGNYNEGKWQTGSVSLVLNGTTHEVMLHRLVSGGIGTRFAFPTNKGNDAIIATEDFVEANPTYIASTELTQIKVGDEYFKVPDGTTDTAQDISATKTFTGTAVVGFRPQADTNISVSAVADTYSDTLKLTSGNTTGATAGNTELQIFYNYNTGRKIIMPSTDGDVELGRTGNQLKNIFVSGYIKDGDTTGSHSISVAEMVAKISDVQLDGTTCVESGVAKISRAADDKLGLIKTSSTYATETISDGTLVCQEKEYATLTNTAFISKGTLSNALDGITIKKVTSIPTTATENTLYIVTEA